MSFFGVDSDDFRSVGEVMMSWAAVETLVSMSLKNIARRSGPDLDSAEFASLEAKPLMRRIEELRERTDNQAELAAIEDLSTCVDRWLEERHRLAHGMLVLGPNGKSWVTDRGKRLAHSKIPDALRHSQSAYKSALVVFLMSVGEPLTEELLEQPLIRLEDDLPIPNWWQLQRWLAAGRELG